MLDASLRMCDCPPYHTDRHRLALPGQMRSHVQEPPALDKVWDELPAAAAWQPGKLREMSSAIDRRDDAKSESLRVWLLHQVTAGNERGLGRDEIMQLLDRILNDPDVPMDARKVWSLLDELEK